MWCLCTDVPEKQLRPSFGYMTNGKYQPEICALLGCYVVHNGNLPVHAAYQPRRAQISSKLWWKPKITHMSCQTTRSSMPKNIVCTGIDCAILKASFTNTDTQKYALEPTKGRYLCNLDDKVSHTVLVPVFLTVNSSNIQKTHECYMRIPKVFDSVTVQCQYIGVSDIHGLLIPKCSRQERTK
jgi:hypothetical protein